MMAALTMMGLAVRNAGAAKNVLAGIINASTVAIFVFSRDVHWPQALVTAIGRLDAQTRQRKALEARRCRHWRRSHDRAVLDHALGLRMRERSDET